MAETSSGKSTISIVVVPDEEGNNASTATATSNGYLSVSPPERKASLSQHSAQSKAAGKKHRNVENFFLKTDLHGLPEIYEGVTEQKYSQFAFWTIVVVITCALLTWQIYECVMDFYEEPIISTYNLVSSPSGVLLPDLYICPPVRVHKANLAKANVDRVWSERHVDGLLDPPKGNGTGNGLLRSLETVSSAFDGVLKPPKKKGSGIARLSGDSGRPGWVGRRWTPRDAEEYFLKVGYAPDRFIRECSIGGTFAASSEAATCDGLIREVFDAEFGKCFLVALSANGVMQTKQGRGISLVIDLDYKSAYPTTEDSRKRPGGGRYKHQQPVFDGVTLRVGSPFEPGAKSTIIVAAGTKSNLVLERTRLELLERRHFDVDDLCRNEDDAEPYEVLSASLPYSIDSCDLDCVLSNVVAECNCTPPMSSAFLRDDKPAYCTVPQMHECALNVTRIDAARSSLQRCSSKCITGCELETFATRLSWAPMPSRRYRDLLDDDRVMRVLKLMDAHAGSRRTNHQPAMIARPEIRRGGDFTNGTDKGLEAEDEDTLNGTRSASPFGPLWEAAHGSMRGINLHGRRRRRDGSGSAKARYSPPLAKDAGANTYMGRDDVIVLDVFYENMQYVYIEQEHSMTASTFIGNIGGQVGLWMGASIISLVKIVLVLVPFCAARKRKRQNAHRRWGHSITQILWRRRTADLADRQPEATDADATRSWRLPDPHRIVSK